MFFVKEELLFGTYTKKSSQGIYYAVLDTDAQQISTPKVVVKVQNPTYMKVTNNKTLVTVAKKGALGGISAYNANNKEFKFIDEALIKGANPCYVGFDEKRQLIFTANYHKGQIDVYKINANQTLTLTDTVKDEGHGPLPEQDSAHVHYTDLTPDGRLVAVDLGCDTVSTYDISAEGKLTLASVFKTESGFGPRHLVFAHNGEYAYLAGELSSKLSVLRYDKTTGTFSLEQTVKTIPTAWTEHNGAAAIRISADDKFIYVSNRGHNSLAQFKINESHNVDFVGFTSTYGDFPRDFDIDPSGKFLVCVNQNTDNGTLYARDEQTGALTCLQKDIPVPEGVCVCFTDLD